MNTAQRIAKNTGVLILADIIGKVISFFFVIYVARYLGAGGFGILSFALAFTSIFSIFADPGIRRLTIREVARDKSLTKKYLGNVAAIKAILVVITFGLIALVINLMGYPGQTIKVVYLLALYVIFMSFNEMFYSIFQAHERMEFVSLGRIITSVMLLVGALLVINQGLSVIGLAFVYSIASIIAFGYGFIILTWKFVTPRLEIDWSFWKPTVRLALPFGLTTLFWLIYFRVDIVMLSMMKGDEVVGWYSAAYQLVIALSFITVAFFGALFPITSRLYKSSREALINTSQRGFKYLLMIALPIGVGTTILADRFISLIYGSEYANSVIALQILIWAGAISIIFGVFDNLLASIDKQTKLAKQAFICALINIGLNLLLIPRYSYVGAGIATIITNLVAIGILYGYTVKSGYQFSNRFMFKNILKVTAASIIMGVYVIFLQHLNLALLVISSAILYFMVFYLIKGFDSDDLQLFRNLFKRRARERGGVNRPIE